MICIKADIPKETYSIDDKLKAIYHSKDSICIWLFKTQKERNSFMEATRGLLKKNGRNIILIFMGKIQPKRRLKSEVKLAEELKLFSHSDPIPTPMANPKLIQRPKSPDAIPISAPMTTPYKTPSTNFFDFFMFNN